jgi:hypothetical protein
MRTFTRTIRVVHAALALGLFGAMPATAQFIPRSPPPTFQTPQVLVALNPLSIPFNVGSLELEGAVNRGTTLGAVGSYMQFSEDGKRHEFTTGEAKLRVYPDNIAFRGLALGMGLGVTRFATREVVDDGSGFGCCTTVDRQTLDAPTLGMLVDYDWVPNPNTRQFVVGFGVEAKRIIASDDDRNRLGLPTAYLAGRFVVGLAF